MRTARLAGHYLNVLGTASVLALFIDPIFGLPLRIDCLGLFIAFWSGMGLLNGRSGFRTGWLIMLSLGLLLLTGFLISLIWATGPVSGPGRELRTPTLAALHGFVILIFMLPLLALLLWPDTKRWLAEVKTAPPPKYTLTGKVIALYTLAAAALCAVTVVIEKLPDTAWSNSRGGGFHFADGTLGTASAGWMEDKATGRRLYVAWVAFSAETSFGSSSEGGAISFGSHAIEVPKLTPVRYILKPPVGDAWSGNVIIVRKDGKVHRLARRVEPDQIESTLDAAEGVRDLDELQRRLEALLPAADVAAR